MFWKLFLVLPLEFLFKCFDGRLTGNPKTFEVFVTVSISWLSSFPWWVELSFWKSITKPTKLLVLFGCLLSFFQSFHRHTGRIILQSFSQIYTSFFALNTLRAQFCVISVLSLCNTGPDFFANFNSAIEGLCFLKFSQSKFFVCQKAVRWFNGLYEALLRFSSLLSKRVKYGVR